MRRMFVLCLLALLSSGCTRMVRDSCKLGPSGPIPDLGPCALNRPAGERLPFTNLAVEGGGVKGIAYAGALEALEQAGVRSQIRQIAGTSAGAFSALLMTLGYEAKEIQRILLGTNFADSRTTARPARSGWSGSSGGSAATSCSRGWSAA